MHSQNDNRSGYPSIDKPWLKYYHNDAINGILPKANLFKVLYENNLHHGDEIAIEYYHEKITYRTLIKRICVVENALKRVGVKKGDFVTLSMVTTPELIYLFYAIAKMGAIANIIDPRLSKDELVNLVTETETKIIFCIDSAAEHIYQSLQGFDLQIVAVSPGASFSGKDRFVYKVATRTRIPKKVLSWQLFFVDCGCKYKVYSIDDSEQPVLMTHTSGTTGKSKGVLLSHDNINAVALQYKYGMENGRQQKYMAVIPPFIAFGICVAVHLPLCLGMICIPIPRFTVKSFYSNLKRYRPNHFTCTPSNLDYLSNDNRKLDLSDLIVPSVGGDYISCKTEKKINKYLKDHGAKYDLVKGYGMTEVSSSACTTKNGCNKPGSVGFPLVKMTISIFEPNTDQELPYNCEGEICFSGPNVMLGYFKQEEVTKVVIKTHKDGKKWLHSGDIGYMDEDGFLFVIDRMKRIIPLTNGEKLLPSLVERSIMELDEIASCAVVGRKYENGIKPVVYVVKKADISANVIIQHCRVNLKKEIIPEEIIFIDQLPLTPVGKIDYKALE